MNLMTRNVKEGSVAKRAFWLSFFQELLKPSRYDDL